MAEEIQEEFISIGKYVIKLNNKILGSATNIEAAKAYYKHKYNDIERYRSYMHSTDKQLLVLYDIDKDAIIDQHDFE